MRVQRIAADPFTELTPEQHETVFNYLWLAYDFCERYSELFKAHVLNTELDASIEESSDIPDIKEILPRIKKNPDITDIKEILDSWITKPVTIQALLKVRLKGGKDIVGELDELISQGAVPLLSTGKINKLVSSTPSFRLSTKYLSSLLAMKAVALTLPAMKPTNSETILEARERLRDLLPPFWGAMFKLSTNFTEHLKQGMRLSDIEHECEDYIDATVRPALIELNSKLKKDRKSWFHKILSTTAKETKLIIGKPPLTVAGLVSTGLELGANVMLDMAQNESTLQDTSLIFLIELDKMIRSYN